MRIIIVSNRLPVTVIKEEGKYCIKKSAGGLVSGLRSFIRSEENTVIRDAEILWIGWSGITAGVLERPVLEDTIHNEHNCHPVFLTETMITEYYNGCCNQLLWPVFHNMPPLSEPTSAWYDTYRDVNELYCSALEPLLEEDDFVWIQDYHLMLLPSLLKEKRKNIYCSFFLHIPFPPWSFFSTLDKNFRESLFHGLSAADLIGFHTDIYEQNFKNCWKQTTVTTIPRTAVFPMGIDHHSFSKLAAAPHIIQHANTLKEKFLSGKLILSVDRLDHTKGLLHKLRSYQSFLNNYPEWQQKTSLIFVIVPSRTQIPRNKVLLHELETLVTQINDTLGTDTWTPVLYNLAALSTEELVAHYLAADIALITPLKDGMNLIAKEYAAAKHPEKGILILSRNAGASEQLRGAILVDPSDTEGVQQAIADALGMSDRQQQEHMELLMKQLSHYDIFSWGNDIIKATLTVKQTKIKVNRP